MTPEQKVDVLRAACCVAGIDGDAVVEERLLVDKLAKAVGCGTASVDAMIGRAIRDPDFHNEQFSVLKADPQETMAVLIQIAIADGKISQGEDAVLKGLAGNLGVPEKIYTELMAKVNSMLSNDK